MYCRFCGKQIQEDSEFCPYCGSPLSSKKEINYSKKIQNNNGININALSAIASVCFYIGIVAFFILFIKMAPGIGEFKFCAYIAGVIITTIAAIIVRKIRNKSFTKKRQLVALFFGLLLLVPSLVLRIVYECKVDLAIADIPTSGTVCIEIDTDEEFYSYYNEGWVREPYSKITLNGESGEKMFVDLNKTYSAKISAGYEGESGVPYSFASGSTTRTIKFTKDNLTHGYVINEQVSLDGGYAIVKIKFLRTCTFWEVIFYNT